MMSSPTVRVVGVNALVYRRTWKGSVVTAFLNPLLFLFAMGLGLGTLVDRGGAISQLGVSYVAFIAPGLLANTAMQTGASEGMWPVMAGIKWIKTYHAALATPVGVLQLVSGNLLWAGVRVLMSCGAFVLIAVLFGAMPLGPGLLALVPALLTGIAFAAPSTAYTAVAKDETRLVTLFRFGIVPMFLFSGTFFPISQLPGFLQPVARFTPLWHGVEMCRDVTLGDLTLASGLAHTAYLLLWSVTGWYFAVRMMNRKMRP